MWDAIRANTRRSRILIGVMGVLLVLAGAGFGAAYDPQSGAAFGAFVALAVWLVLLGTALAGGTQVMLAGTGARKIRKDEAPRLWNVVEEMTIAAGLGKMPDVYVIDDEHPNAFAVGQRPEVAAVAVTTGLLRRMNRDELQGVVAHEIGHVRNLDVRFMTIAGVMLGAIVLISDIFLRSLWFTGGRRRAGGDRGGGQAQILLVILAVALAILAPLAARLLYLACSRQREYLADASAARFTRYPAGLASALEKISAVAQARKRVNRVLAPMYIVNPLQSRGLTGLFSTHPPTERRIRILREMAGASWADYEAAYHRIRGAGATALLDRGVLDSDAGAVPVRAAGAEP